MKDTIMVLAACLTATAAVAGFGYYLGRDTASSEVAQIERELELLKSAENIENVFDYLADIQKYNQELFRLSEYEDKIFAKNEEISMLMEQIGEQRLELEDQYAQVAELKADNDRLTSREVDLTRQLDLKYHLDDRFFLARGQSFELFGGASIVGLKSVYPTYVSITLNNQSTFLDIGERAELTVENASCFVSVVNIDEPNAIAAFDLICRHIARR